VALGHLDEAADLFAQLHDAVLQANCRYLMGSRCVQAGLRLEEAERWLHEARELAARSGSRHEWLHAEVVLAELEQRRQNPALSGARFEALVPEFRRIGDRRCVGRSLVGLGVALAAAGDQEAAGRHLRDAVRALRSVGPIPPMAAALGWLAELERRAGDSRHAALLLGAADEAAVHLDLASREALPPAGELRSTLDRDLGSGELAALLADGRRTPVDELIGP
jgi:hypothetical protein